MDAFDPIKASVVFGDHTGVARLMKLQTSGLDPLSERIQIRQRAQRDAPGARSPLTFTSSRSVVAPCYPRTVFTPTSSSVHDVMRFSSIVLLPVALASLVAAGPIAEKRASFTLQNGRDAQALNRKFQSLSANAPCNSGENACINGGFAQCANGRWVTFPCNAGLKCFALPLVLSPQAPGLSPSLHSITESIIDREYLRSLVCDTEADAAARIASTGAGGLFGRDVEESV